MQAAPVLSALAAAFVVSEALAILAVSLGLWEATFVGRLLGGLFTKPRGVPGQQAAPPPPPLQPPLADADAAAHEPEPPQPEPSASTQPSAPALEPSGHSTLAPHALDGLPSEVGRDELLPAAAAWRCFRVRTGLASNSRGDGSAPHPPNLQISFTHGNALAQTTSEEGGGSGGPSGGASELLLAAVKEGSSDGEGDEEEDEDSFGSCTELTFEPSAAGAPGITLVQRSISGLGAAAGAAEDEGRWRRTLELAAFLLQSGHVHAAPANYSYCHPCHTPRSCAHDALQCRPRFTTAGLLLSVAVSA